MAFVLHEPLAIEGYTPAARPRRALGIILSANKVDDSMLLYFLLFHTPPLYTGQYVPYGLFFLFFEPPTPPSFTRVCWGSGLG